MWSTPKTGERRSVPFPASLTEELAALMVGKGRDDLVFTNLRGDVLRGSNYRPRFFDPAVDEAARAADETFPTITPHDLRHTAASLAVSAGANVKAVQRMLGHAKASMTLDVYADLFDDDLDVVADRLDAAIKSGAASGRHRPNRECPTCGQSVVAEGGRPREAAIQSAADQLRTGSESLLSITPRPADTPARSS